MLDLTHEEPFECAEAKIDSDKRVIRFNKPKDRNDHS